MSFRIKKYERGFVVEVEKRGFYGRRYWTHFISVSGISTEPWFHSSYEYAETNLLDEIRCQTVINSRQCWPNDEI